jgi:hypothetical protein
MRPMLLPTRKTGSKSATPVVFRPEQSVFDELEKRARATGLSVGQLACHYVTETIRGKEADKEEGDPLLKALEELREDIAVGVETLLVSAGKTGEIAARKWVDENLRV